MKNMMTKLFISLGMILGTYLSYAQLAPEPPSSPNSGDIGGPTTPIDAYVYAMMFIVPFLVAYYVRKKRNIKNYSN